MAGTAMDLDRALHTACRDAQAHGHEWDVADAREAVLQWLSMPEPRGQAVAETLPPPVALVAALTPGPHCLGCDGTCRLPCQHEETP